MRSDASHGPATAAATLSHRNGMTLAGRLSTLAKIAIGMVMALTPVTAILVLGWLMRIMRRETAIAVVARGHGITRRAAIGRLGEFDRTAHLAGFPGWWRGLWDTGKAGLAGVGVIAVATLPFGALLLISWWAGWENSFNKGYEQAWVGRTLALIAIGLGAAVLCHWPMMLAHTASERRIGAVLEVGVVRRLIRRVRWRYLALTLATVVMSAPLLLAQILPTFIESIRPDLATAGPEALAQFANRWHAATTVYLVLTLLILRKWAARLYARAVVADMPASARFVREVAEATSVMAQSQPSRTPGRLGELISGIATAACWIGLLALVYIAQFANHAWWNWLNQPLIGLPWVFRPL